MVRLDHHCLSHAIPNFLNYSDYLINQYFPELESHEQNKNHLL